LFSFTEGFDEVISKIRKYNEGKFNKKYDLNEYWLSNGADWVRCPPPPFHLETEVDPFS
jgi:hypothetical protein